MARSARTPVDPAKLGSIALLAAMIGLLAGLAAATFASIAGEPAIEEAIAIEQARAASEGQAQGAGLDGETRPADGDEATVSRSDQRGVGLFGAYALTGAAFGGLLALTAHGLRRGRPDPFKRILLAGVILAGALTLAPWLKYPPNPPAVGDAATLGQRQSLYITLICIAAGVGLVATILDRHLRAAGWANHRRVAAVTASVAIPMLAAFVLLPPAPDLVTVPATLVWRFRLASLGANLTLWTVLTLAVGWVVAAAQEPPTGLRAVPAPSAQAPVGGVF